MARGDINCYHEQLVRQTVTGVVIPTAMTALHSLSHLLFLAAELQSIVVQATFSYRDDLLPKGASESATFTRVGRTAP